MSDWLSSVRRVLVVAAHPDDEVLGCGGLLARLTAGGAEAFVLGLTGITESRGAVARDAAPTIEREFAAAMRTLGVTQSRRLGLPDNRLDTVPLLDIVQAVEQTKAFEPDLVITHSLADLNVDHRLAHQATITAYRPAGARTPRILSFEVPSSTEWQDSAAGQFRPTCYADIGAYLSKKIEAMDCYQSELRDPPHPRSLAGIEARARLRGFEVCLSAAEAFQLVRDVT